MTIGINQAIPALVPAKGERNGAKAHDGAAGFGAALERVAVGKSDGHHREAKGASEQKGEHHPLRTKQGTRGEGGHDNPVAADETSDVDAVFDDPSTKTGSTPLSAMIAARELDARAERGGKGGQPAQAAPGSTARADKAEPEIKLTLDPASLAAAGSAARKAPADTPAAKGHSAVQPGQTLAMKTGPDTPHAAPTGMARMPNAAAITLSLTNAGAADAASAPADAALTPGRDFLRTLAAGTNGNRSQPNEFGRRPDARSERVTVVSQQNIPAPVAQPGQSTAVGLANLISADPGWKAATTTSFQPLAAAQPNLASAHTLKLQLHPAELGMVTANLRFSGEHLTVELSVENGEAYRRLSADSETIVKSLRSMGLNIDQVTIQQPQASATAQGGADGNNAAAGFGQRDQAFASAHSGGDGNGSGRQASAGNTSDGSYGSSEDAAPAASNRSGDGLYI